MQQRCRGGINSCGDQLIHRRFTITKSINRETQEILLLRRKMFFVKALMTKVALALNDPHKCYSASISPIDEKNDSVSKSWIVFRLRIVAKLTFAVEYSAAEDLALCNTGRSLLQRGRQLWSDWQSLMMWRQKAGAGLGWNRHGVNEVNKGE